jgi:hypothetical protein
VVAAHRCGSSAFSTEAALASRRNRFSAWLSLDRSSGQNFKATYRSNRDPHEHAGHEGAHEDAGHEEVHEHAGTEAKRS